MKQESNEKKEGKVKKFLSKLAAKLDKTMEEKAKSGSCGCSEDDSKDGSSCCK